MLFQALADPRFFAPFRTLRQLERLLVESDLAFESDHRTFLPVALYARGNDSLLRAVLPGVEPKDVAIEVEDDTVTLSGRWPSVPEAEQALAQHIERPRGEFRRSLRLAYEIDAARVQARMQHGVLEVELPRLEKEPPRKIQVTTEGPKA
jgi:HSP20 family protein